MIFRDPVPFTEAIQADDVRALVGTTLGSAALEALREQTRDGASLLERARFSARLSNFNVLRRIDELVARLVAPETDAVGQPTQPGEILDMGSARIQLRQILDQVGYQPDPEDEGTVADLRAERRLNLILDTNRGLAQGYGSFVQGNDPDVLLAFPAQELFRAIEAKEPRDWPARWAAAGGVIQPDGSFLARKDSAVWTRISRFGVPYPPFDFNSGMRVRDVSRRRAVAAGVLNPGDVVAPTAHDFNAELALDVPDRQDALFRAFAESLGPDFEIRDGVLGLAAAPGDEGGDQ